MEQKNMSKRIVIDMKSKNFMIKKTVVALRIPLKLTKDQNENAMKIYEKNLYDTMRFGDMDPVK
jgi:hypothetical protein